MRRILPVFIFLSLIFCRNISAQEKAYFQQHVAYEIHVSLDDSLNMLYANEKIIYTNNSPEELIFIWFHLWPNAYKDNTTAFARQQMDQGDIPLIGKRTSYWYADVSRRGWIDSLDFKVNGKAVKLEYDPKNIDIAKIILNEPLGSGEKIEITTPFRVKIPDSFSRMGHVGDSYQISQWYPKPAVYDKYGWHPMPYLDQGEFYSEFGTFDVYITIPKNYVLCATGDLPAGEPEIDWLNKRAEKTETLLKKFLSPDTARSSGLKMKKDSTGRQLTIGLGGVSITYKTKTDSLNPPEEFPKDEKKTLHFHQENVHDFAWFCDKDYLAMKTFCILPWSGDSVECWSIFHPENANVWKNSADFVRDAVYWYSKWYGDYPYRHATAVDGALSAGGGMEYPNITVIGSMGSETALDEVIAHEVGHNWFYGILGSNERDHAWMDEGINTFSEFRYTAKKYSSDSLTALAAEEVPKGIAKFLGINNLSSSFLYRMIYLIPAWLNTDQPMDYPATEYSPLNYGGIVYMKTGIMFQYLQVYLGDSLFDRCMQRYYREWKFKHPYPEDIKKIFVEETKQDLDWFFNDIVTTTKKIDYKISGVKVQNDNLRVRIKEPEQIDGAILLQTIDKNKNILESRWIPAGSFHLGGSYHSTISEFKKENVKYVCIDAKGIIPDINRANNQMQIGSLFRRPSAFQLLWKLEQPGKYQIFFLPIANFNHATEFSAGLMLYHGKFPPRKFSFGLSPMWSFADKEIIGSASAKYTMFPLKTFQNISLEAKTKNMQDIVSLQSELNFKFRNPTPRIRQSYSIKIRGGYFESEYLKSQSELLRYGNTPFSDLLSFKNYLGYWCTKSLPPQCFYDFPPEIGNFIYAGVQFNYSVDRTLRKFSFKINYDFINDRYNYHTKLYGETTFGFRWTKSMELTSRFFGGTFLTANPVDKLFQFGLSGNLDPLGDAMFIVDRGVPGGIQVPETEWIDFNRHQFTENDGNFKSRTNVFADKWMFALNLENNLPRVPLFGRTLRIWADVGTFNDGDIYSDAGVGLSLFRNVFKIYFPVYGSHIGGFPVDISRPYRFSINLDLNNLNIRL